MDFKKAAKKKRLLQERHEIWKKMRKAKFNKDMKKFDELNSKFQWLNKKIKGNVE